MHGNIWENLFYFSNDISGHTRPRPIEFIIVNWTELTYRKTLTIYNVSNC